MLNLILGRAGSGKTEYLRNVVKDALDVHDRRVYFIVPEQFTFSNEKAMLKYLGAKDAQRAEIFSFSRLAAKILSDAGRIDKTRLTRGGRTMLMYRAVSEIADRLAVYRKSVRNTAFTEKMLSTVTELRMCGITPGNLREASFEMDGVLASKLRDTALIMETYDAVAGERFSDMTEDLTLLCEYLKEEKHFKGAYVVFDSFSGFTVQERNVVEQIMLQAGNVYVALCAGCLETGGKTSDVFYPCKYTAAKLMDIAAKNRVSVASPVVLGGQHRFKNSELEFLERNFLAQHSETYAGSAEAVKLVECEDVYDECNFIAAEIKKLICTGGYRCRDIAVITGDDESFLSTIKWTFEKYGVPVFEDLRQPVEYQPLIKMAEYALEVVSSGFETSNVLKYAKCGLAGVGIEEISELENYVTMWRIDRQSWKREFILHPDGYKSEMSRDGAERLARIDGIRRILVEPLVQLEDEIESSGGRNIAQALWRFVDESGVRDALRGLAAELDTEGEPSVADELGQVWDLFCDMLDEMALILEDEAVGVDQFLKLYRVFLSSLDVGSIPQGLDEVTVGDASRIRTDNPKVVFVAGANEGVFPGTPAETGIFGYDEREKMLANNLEIRNTFDYQVAIENLSAYGALTSAGERLYVCFRDRDASENRILPSVIVGEMMKIFPELEILHTAGMDVMDKIESKQSAFEYMTASFYENTEEEAALKKYFSSDEEYGEKFRTVVSSAGGTAAYTISESSAVELFGSNMHISASKVEDYYNCPFRYFCKFGLRLRPRVVAELNPMNTGTVIHFVLENIVRMYGGKGLSKIGEREMRSSIRNLLDEYLENSMGGEIEKTKRFTYLYGRLTSTVYTVVSHLARELEQSRFEPVDFELRINNDGDVRPLRLRASDGSVISVYGIVDRVDVMKKDGKSYLRVIDYKTGTKVFALDDVFEGLNMQMLIYLFSIWRNGGERYGDIVPSGILYMPAYMPYTNLERHAGADAIRAEADKKLCMNGLVLDDPEVIEGMEQDIGGVFIPVSRKKNEITGSLISLEMLGRLEKKVESLLVQMAESLHSGDIAGKPHEKGQTSACDYCDYRKVCRYPLI